MTLLDRAPRPPFARRATMDRVFRADFGPRLLDFFFTGGSSSDAQDAAGSRGGEEWRAAGRHALHQ